MTFQAHAGEEITSASKRAIAHAQLINSVVVFGFNGVKCVADPSYTPERVVEQFHIDMERNRVAYQASPEGKKAAAETDARRAAAQHETRRLERMFEHYWEDALLFHEETLEPLLSWLKDYALAVDFIGVEANPDPIITILKDFGFTAGMHVTTDKAAVEQWTPRICAEWIVGQALSMGLRSHPGMICGAIKFWSQRCEQAYLTVNLKV